MFNTTRIQSPIKWSKATQGQYSVYYAEDGFMQIDDPTKYLIYKIPDYHLVDLSGLQRKAVIVVETNINLIANGEIIWLWENDER